jgi:hypothetical protein
MSWRMEKMCANCPFAKAGPGRELARSLNRGRMAEIKRGLRRGEVFYCHKTTGEDGEGEAIITSKAKACAGALAYQEEQGVSSNYQRVCESLEYFAEQRAKRAAE